MELPSFQRSPMVDKGPECPPTPARTPSWAHGAPKRTPLRTCKEARNNANHVGLELAALLARCRTVRAQPQA